MTEKDHLDELLNNAREREPELGEPVEKYTGEARWEGVLLAKYKTTRGKIRYVVEVTPQGFQMICVPNQIRPAPPKP